MATFSVVDVVFDTRTVLVQEAVIITHDVMTTERVQSFVGDPLETVAPTRGLWFGSTCTLHHLLCDLCTSTFQEAIQCHTFYKVDRTCVSPTTLRQPFYLYSKRIGLTVRMKNLHSLDNS
eukprot:PhF_6_TR42668/c1_g2_i2/m.64322